MRYICLTILALLLIGCSKEEFDLQRAEELASIAESRNLTPDETGEMISQDAFLMDEVRETLHGLLQLTDPEKFRSEYERLKSDVEYNSKAELADRMWRILLLSRPRLTEANADAFSSLYDKVKIVDLYRDDISERLNDSRLSD